MALIQNMGLFWHVENVFWGKQGAGNEGQLLGVPAKNVMSDEIDFREQIAIYVLYSEFRVIYVGQTGSKKQRLLARMKQHLTDDLAERWDRFSWFGFRWVKADGCLSNDNLAASGKLAQVLNEIEGILIHAIEPPLNRQQGRFGAGVKRYLQVRDDRLGENEDVMTRQMWEKLVKNAK